MDDGALCGWRCRWDNIWLRKTPFVSKNGKFRFQIFALFWVTTPKKNVGIYRLPLYRIHLSHQRGRWWRCLQASTAAPSLIFHLLVQFHPLHFLKGIVQQISLSVVIRVGTLPLIIRACCRWDYGVEGERQWNSSNAQSCSSRRLCQTSWGLHLHHRAMK